MYSITYALYESIKNRITKFLPEICIIHIKTIAIKTW